METMEKPRVAPKPALKLSAGLVPTCIHGGNSRKSEEFIQTILILETPSKQ
jgi:hypothetical protein